MKQAASRVIAASSMLGFPACLTLHEDGGKIENSCLNQTLLNPNSLVREEAAVLI
jgi:hypothetical protein